MPRDIRAGIGPRPFILEPGETMDVPDSRFIRGRIRAGDLEVVVVDKPPPTNMRAAAAPVTTARPAALAPATPPTAARTDATDAKE